jgi:hypothetical protein
MLRPHRLAAAARSQTFAMDHDRHVVADREDHASVRHGTREAARRKHGRRRPWFAAFPAAGSCRLRPPSSLDAAVDGYIAIFGGSTADNSIMIGPCGATFVDRRGDRGRAR